MQSSPMLARENQHSGSLCYGRFTENCKCQFEQIVQQNIDPVKQHLFGSGRGPARQRHNLPVVQAKAAAFRRGNIMQIDNQAGTAQNKAGLGQQGGRGLKSKQSCGQLRTLTQIIPYELVQLCPLSELIVAERDRVLVKPFAHGDGLPVFQLGPVAHQLRHMDKVDKVAVMAPAEVPPLMLVFTIL